MRLGLPWMLAFALCAAGTVRGEAAPRVIAPEGVEVRVEGAGEDGGEGRPKVLIRDTRGDQAGLDKVDLVYDFALPEGTRLLGDAWERAYGELGWRDRDHGKWMPWYFIADTGKEFIGFGVETGPNALACWRVTVSNVTLRLDVRAAGEGVLLGDRELEACRVVRVETAKNAKNAKIAEAEFAREFCRAMCPKPKLPKEPIYGMNDWNSYYGKNTATNFLADAAAVFDGLGDLEYRPYAVVDDGWEKRDRDEWFAWDGVTDQWGMTIPEFFARLKAMNLKPGLWYRPFAARKDTPVEMLVGGEGPKSLDPTLPETKAIIAADIKRFVGWGARLVKADFLVYELCGRWGLSYTDKVIPDGRTFADRSRTTAEVSKDLYRTMKDAAGEDCVIIGCNAFNHLAAGIFESQRIGDDTSGRDWARTERMGGNAVKYRAAQHGTFFFADPDCVGLAREGAIAWENNREWLGDVERSGMSLWISWPRSLLTPEIKSAFDSVCRTLGKAK